MLTASLTQSNIHFAYIDSGQPENSSDYTTLVCIHGNTYHAQTFQRILPLAAQHNVRLIALNRRDYIGSTPFSDAELASLLSTDASKHQQFLYDRGLEIAYFLLWVINELKIPRTSDGGKRGGLALLGWSLGNITSVAFLANLTRYPKDVVEKLEPYLRHYFIYEVIYQFLGIPSPEGAYHPLWDDSIPFDQKPAAIDDWFTSYFTHPYFTHSSSHQRTLTSLQLHPPRSPIKPPSNAKSPETTDTDPVMRSEIAFYFNVSESTLFDQYRSALSGQPPPSNSEQQSDSEPAHVIDSQHGLPLPNLRVSVIDATHTVWNIIYASWSIQEDLEKWKSEGRGVRPVEFLTIEGANHYAVWDEPELLMKTLADCLK